MTGHHEVRRFRIKAWNGILTLPSGWKPFAVIPSYDGFDVVCRKWVRDETKTAKEPST